MLNIRHFADGIFIFTYVSEKVCILFFYSFVRQVGITSGNGFAPPRRYAITWTNDDQVRWRSELANECTMHTWRLDVNFLQV